MGIGLSIAGGFGNRLSEYMRDKEKFDWENKRAERKFGMTTGQLGVAKAEDIAAQNVSKVNYMLDREVDPKLLRYVYDQDKVAGIDLLYNTIQGGSASASGEQLNALVNYTKTDAEVDNRPWRDVFLEAGQIYATPKGETTNEQKNNKNFFARMLADPGTSDYDDGQRYGGYTRADQDRIIMASTTTPRGQNSLRINRDKIMPDLSTTDFSRINTQTSSAIKLQQEIVVDNVILRGKNPTEDERNYDIMLANDDWIGITSIYGDAMLQSLYEAENSFPGGVLNNPAITQGQKAWLRNKYAKEEEQISDGSSVVEPPVAITGGTIDFAAEFEKAKSSFPEGTDLTAPRFNSVADVRKATANKTISDLDPYFVYVPGEGWKAQAKIDLANFSQPGDGDFLKWAKDIPEKRSEATELFGVKEYKGLLQANVSSIDLIKRVTKIVTSKTTGKEYTFAEYSKAFGIGDKNKADSLGLPRTNRKWDNASEANGYTIKYDLTPYTYSGDK
tara:strand:- start:191 stop:1699 length:1509 start_codon:yes stop_codon:yes gene_type:complete